MFAQRFALMHELVKLDDELECMCELWRAVEVITSGAEISLSPSMRWWSWWWYGAKSGPMERVRGEEWTNGKSARACAYIVRRAKLSASSRRASIKSSARP